LALNGDNDVVLTNCGVWKLSRKSTNFISTNEIFLPENLDLNVASGKFFDFPKVRLNIDFAIQTTVKTGISGRSCNPS
jgi:hypothetical protein